MKFLPFVLLAIMTVCALFGGSVNGAPTDGGVCALPNAPKMPSMPNFLEKMKENPMGKMGENPMEKMMKGLQPPAMKAAEPSCLKA